MRVINHWNKLTQETANASLVNVFSVHLYYGFRFGKVVRITLFLLIKAMLDDHDTRIIMIAPGAATPGNLVRPDEISGHKTMLLKL